MKPVIITVLFAVLQLTAIAQHKNFFVRLHEKTHPPRDTIHIIPYDYTAIKFFFPALMEPATPTLLLAAEKRWRKLGVQLQLGGVIPKSYTVDDTISGIRSGFRTKVDVRWYFKLGKKNRDFFVAPELFYHQNKNKGAKYFGDSTLADLSYYDEYEVRKIMYGAAIKAGLQKRFFRHFLLEIQVGIGAKMKHVSQKSRENPEHRDSYRHALVHDDKIGTYGAVMFPVNFAFGYLLY